jgi:glycosyltransferase involved in cell wall biosynthesis
MFHTSQRILASAQIEISLVIPMYNEIDYAKKCVEDAEKSLSTISDSYEIILAEDGSTDGTHKFVRHVARINPHVRCTSSDTRLGKGQAITNAIKLSSGKIVAIVDADGICDQFSLRRLVEKARDTNGIVVGSRVLGGIADYRPLSRRMASKAYNGIARFFFGDNIQDHQFGFKALTRDAVETLAPYLRETGFAWDTEVISLARRFGFEVVEIPIESMEKRNGTSSSSKVKIFADGASMARSLVRIKGRIVGLSRIVGRPPYRPRLSLALTPSLSRILEEPAGSDLGLLNSSEPSSVIMMPGVLLNPLH